ncbi:major facilitator superfamily domain-containing protein [Dactylonectria estremocensis]|uniref:Major facilitator superfamily domain-containing protein n=1 Tax=Dactylonectria estremocensis TaxID=1079267 RepID=A0A9P9FE78_9HYPO|nr:major facilitator superfamily domain-containing protein [Dactylonectria estremocensis]
MATFAAEKDNMSEPREERVSDAEAQKNSMAGIDPALADYVPGTDEEKALVRKIDLFLLPTIWLMYLLSYMDRTNIGNAKIAGMADDLGMDSNMYSVTLVVFFIGYVLCEVPSNMILARTRPSIFLPAIMFVWGLVTVGMGWVPTYRGLIGFRVVVGVLEAGFAPGVLLLLSSWYKKSEQSKRFAVYISAAILSGAFGGLLAGAITEGMDGVKGLAGWRWLFIVEGAATSAWSLVATFILLDFPANTKRLTDAERHLAILRLKSEALVHTEDQPALGHLAALKVALTNWRTWLFVVGYMAIVGSSTLSYFYPTLVNGLGYDSHIAQYMTIPIYICAFFCTALTGIFMDRHPSKRAFVLGAWLSIAMLCAIIICAVYNFKARYSLLVIMASALWSSNGLALSYTSSTFSEAPAEVRAILLAFVNAMGNLAQIYGAYLFPSDDQPKYLMGFGVISGLCFTGVAAYLALGVLLKK